jgi:protein-S-isoprenylcysteine O-methyltransferase Ste14
MIRAYTDRSSSALGLSSSAAIPKSGISNSAASSRTARRINKRLFIPKLLFWPLIAFAVVSQSAYGEGTFWGTTLEVVSFLILLAGAMGRVWVSAYISGRKNSELVTDGPYSMTRNPLYFFSFVAYVGAGLAFEKMSVAFAFGFTFFLTHWMTILAEEGKLRRIYGATYDNYAERVPRFLPRIKTLQFPKFVTFRATTFNRAILDCTLIMLVFVLAHVIEYFQNCQILPILIKNVP